MPTKSPPPEGEEEPLSYVWNGRGVEPRHGRHAEKLELLIEALRSEVGARDALLLKGWSLQMVARKYGESAGQLDSYFFSPDGSKYRSRSDVITAYRAGRLRGIVPGNGGGSNLRSSQHSVSSNAGVLRTSSSSSFSSSSSTSSIPKRSHKKKPSSQLPTTRAATSDSDSSSVDSSSSSSERSDSAPSRPPPRLPSPPPYVPGFKRFKGLAGFPNVTSKHVTDVLFYGDSLTFGMAHNFTGRYEETWPRMLEERLEQRGFRVIESALCSRTTIHDDDGNNDWLEGAEPHFFNGIDHLACEFAARNVAVLVLLLGTNDLKTKIRERAKARTRVDASFIAKNCANVALKAREIHASLGHKNPLQILVICPPLVRLNALSRDLGYDESSVKIAAEFPEAYRVACERNELDYLHVNGLDMGESLDGVHFNPSQLSVVAEAVWPVLESMLPQISSSVPSKVR